MISDTFTYTQIKCQLTDIWPEKHLALASIATMNTGQ